MSFYINNEPAEPRLVAKGALLMTWKDLETFALTLESIRSKGKSESKAKITAKMLHQLFNEVLK